jgi:toxin HigB-1
MIKSFRHKGLESYWKTGSTKGIPAQHARRIKRILDLLDSAATIDELRVPGFNLHQLKGDRAGTWAITVSGNWRITFEFIDGDAYNVDLEDYH